ncbi:HAD family hydrolase [Catellatospora coxensis]
MTVVASDKTGTMTEGRMTVRRAVTPGADVAVTGIGYEPAGRISGTASPLPQSLLDLARAGTLCSDAAVLAPAPDRPAWTAVGDPLEAALVTFGARCGLDPDAVRANAPRWAEHPFDQATRQMTTVHRDGDTYLTICKGAPESVLGAPVVDPADPHLAATRQAAADLAASGLRVLAIAAGTTAEPTNPIAPTGLRPLGVIGIEDPLRPSAATTAAEFTQAGIRLMLITGDHPGTAAHIAAQVGIWNPGDPIATGDQPEQAHRVRVFARTQPEQKLDIIAELQHHGHVVAMTGDGVNDAPRSPAPTSAWPWAAAPRWPARPPTSSWSTTTLPRSATPWPKAAACTTTSAASCATAWRAGPPNWPSCSSARCSDWACPAARPDPVDQLAHPRPARRRTRRRTRRTRCAAPPASPTGRADPR